MTPDPTEEDASVNIESHILLDTTIGEVQDALRDGDQPALAVLEGVPTREHRFADYLRDPAKAAKYEQQLAREVAGIDLDRLIIAVPMIVTPRPLVGEESILLRSPFTGPLRDDLDEYDVIAYTIFDVEEGVTTGMALYTRNPDGTYTFGLDGDEKFTVTVPVNPSRKFPGMALLREILDETLHLRADLRREGDPEPG